MGNDNTIDLSNSQNTDMPLGPSNPKPEEHHSKGITIGAPKHQGPSPEVLHLNSQISEISRRIRILEERYSNLRRKTQVTDQNMLSIQKTLTREIKTIDDQLNDLQKSINELKEKMAQILRETKNFALGEDISILKRYLDFWQPLNFLTKDEAEQLIEDMINKKNK